MKKISFALAFFISLQSYSQTGKPLSFCDVVKLDSNIKATVLFSAARAWFNEAFKDASAVLNIQDKETGELAGKGSIGYEPKSIISSGSTRGHITYTISIWVKDGRYKYEITNFIHHGTLSSICDAGLITTDEYCDDCLCQMPKSLKKKYYSDFKTNIGQMIDILVPSLKKAMETATTKKDDW